MFIFLIEENGLSVPMSQSNKGKQMASGGTVCLSPLASPLSPVLAVQPLVLEFAACRLEALRFPPDMSVIFKGSFCRGSRKDRGREAHPRSGTVQPGQFCFHLAYKLEFHCREKKLAKCCDVLLSFQNEAPSPARQLDLPRSCPQGPCPGGCNGTGILHMNWDVTRARSLGTVFLEVLAPGKREPGGNLSFPSLEVVLVQLFTFHPPLLLDSHCLVCVFVAFSV